MYKRILKMLMSQGFGLLMNVIEKLLMVPLFIHAWGLSKFGEWILVRTIPNILLTSDIGISSHTGNEVNYYAENKNYKQVAKTIYLSVMMMIIIIVALMLIGILQFFIDARGLFGVLIIPKEEFPLAVFLMIIHASLILVSQLICGIGRVKDNYTFYAFWAQIARFVEITSVSFSLFFLKADIIIVSLCYVLTRVLINSIMMFVLIKELRNLGCLGAFKGIPFNEYLAFIRKSVSYASISITQTIFMQGSSIIVANLFGPAMLAIITIARNVSRFLVMFSSLLSKSIWTELTKLWAKGEVVKFKQIFNKFAIVNSVIITIGFALMVLFYPFIIKWFNINQNIVANTFWIYIAVCLHSFLLAISYYSNIALIASSNHVGYAKLITMLSFISLIIFALISYFIREIVTAYFIAFCSVEILTIAMIHFIFMKKIK
ncbi:repeat unit exporter [Klebsiella quasipneumoniae]|uniref:transporter n=1 Tax=Klebsiella quasipneumoniae TaxID=1463165 RepID=UPI001250E7CF|nr:transporter [Klebsiella quasipneumoniae]VAO25279.1 repeat unit exporter [Klebsiella quasipneumoniae]